jgi:hypothetical protein
VVTARIAASAESQADPVLLRDRGEPGLTEDLASGVLDRANDLALLARHLTNLLVALLVLVKLAQPTSGADPAGGWLIAAVGGWALYRLGTRSPSRFLLAADIALVWVICAATPALQTGPESAIYLVAQRAIVATSLFGFATALPIPILLATTGLIIATYVWGCGSLTGSERFTALAAVSYMAIAAACGAAFRMALLRISAVAKRTYDRYVAAVDMRKRVAVAAREYEREQFALLHDTVASTLLLVANGTPIAPARLATQARAALEVLDGQPSQHQQGRRVELVAAIRTMTDGIGTPVQLRGRSEVWMAEERARSIVAVTREIMNNVDRHARATRIAVVVSDHRIIVSDDGCGFTPDHSANGHGIQQSIVARMERIGGTAIIHSASGRGTRVDLVWPNEPQRGAKRAAVTDSDRDSDRFVRLARMQYGYVMVAWSSLVLLLTFPYSLQRDSHPYAQAGAAALALLACMAALPVMRNGDRAARWIGVIILLSVTVVQSAILAERLLGTEAQWSLWATGWCLLPLLRGLPRPTVVAIIGANAAAACVVTFARYPSVDLLVGLGFVAASPGVLLIASLVAERMFDEAVTSTDRRTQASLDSVARQQATVQGLREFRRRIAGVRDNVVPILVALSRVAPIDQALRQRAQVESQRIRTLLDQQLEHPLVYALRPTLDAAGRNNADVVVHVQPDLPTLRNSQVADATRVVSQVLNRRAAAIRLVVATVGTEFVVSVVCRGYVGDLEFGDADIARGRLEVLQSGDTVWVTIGYRLPTTTAGDAGNEFAA